MGNTVNSANTRVGHCRSANHRHPQSIGRSFPWRCVPEWRRKWTRRRSEESRMVALTVGDDVGKETQAGLTQVRRTSGLQNAVGRTKISRSYGSLPDGPCDGGTLSSTGHDCSGCKRPRLGSPTCPSWFVVGSSLSPIGSDQLVLGPFNHAGERSGVVVSQVTVKAGETSECVVNHRVRAIYKLRVLCIGCCARVVHPSEPLSEHEIG